MTYLTLALSAIMTLLRLNFVRVDSNSVRNATRVLPKEASEMSMNDKEQNANRPNGQKLRGPKNTSATRYNARKHGLLAAGLTELDKGYRTVLRDLMAELKPVGPLEDILVQSAALEIVRLSRARRLEAEHITSVLNPPNNKLGISLDEIFDPGKPAAIDALDAQPLVNIFQRYESVIFNRLFRTLHELERRQRMRLGDSVPPPASLDVSVEVSSTDVTEIASPRVPSASILLDAAEPGMLANDRAGSEGDGTRAFEPLSNSVEYEGPSDQEPL
jgi:hypothetical protein